MKKIHNLHIYTTQLLILSLLALLTACHKSTPIPEPEPKPEIAPRTVLVYMIASNNLGSGGYDESDLKEMRIAAAEGQLGNGRLIVYHAPYNRKSGDATPVLKEVTATGVDTLKVYESGTTSVSIEQMRQVIDDTKDLASAHSYGIVFWSHATGWLQDGMAENNHIAYSYGQDFGQKMNISSLAQALDGQDLDFIYFDCCYMGSVESLYELRHAANVIVASATEVPMEGMPYHLNMKYFFAQPYDMVGAATSTFESYQKTYSENPDPKNQCPVSMAVVNTEYLDQLAQCTRIIYEQATESFPDGYYPQKFSTDATCYYFDLEDYVHCLAGDTPLFDQWKEALSKAVSYSTCTSTIWGRIEVSRFCGLSTFILQGPTYSTIKHYDTLQWYTDVASHLFN